MTGETPEVRSDKRKPIEDKQNHRYHGSPIIDNIDIIDIIDIMDLKDIIDLIDNMDLINIMDFIDINRPITLRTNSLA